MRAFAFFWCSILFLVCGTPPTNAWTDTCMHDSDFSLCSIDGISCARLFPLIGGVCSCTGRMLVGFFFFQPDSALTVGCRENHVGTRLLLFKRVSLYTCKGECGSHARPYPSVALPAWADRFMILLCCHGHDASSAAWCCPAAAAAVGLRIRLITPQLKTWERSCPQCVVLKGPRVEHARRAEAEGWGASTHMIIHTDPWTWHSKKTFKLLPQTISLWPQFYILWTQMSILVLSFSCLC